MSMGMTLDYKEQTMDVISNYSKDTNFGREYHTNYFFDLDQTKSLMPSEIFMELASDTRCEILKMLNDASSQATKIASNLNLTKQETHRNTARLTQVGLIKKDAGGLFSLTEFGRAVTSQFSFFQFLNRHKKFFENHTFENIPEKFVKRLGDLENTQLITSVVKVIEKLKTMEAGTKNQLKHVVSQAWTEEGKIVLDILKRNVKMYTLFGKNTVVPSELAESRLLKEIERLQFQRENPELRLINKVEFSVYIADENCGIMFPNRNGEIDMNNMFVGNDAKVFEWCNDVFDHYWKLSRPIRSIKDLAK